VHGRTVRLFISSTFSDFVAEREALRTTVFPELADFCRARGASFQPIDLRWGVNEAATRQNDTLRICLEEIARSRRVSPRPNFVALIGSRYGWRPLPALIPIPIWLKLRRSVHPSRWRNVARVYARDPERNLDPPAMVLRPMETGSSESLHAAARDVLTEAALALPPSLRLPLLASATHQEIQRGLLEPEDAGMHVRVYVRHVSGLPSDSRARDYIDWDDRRGCPCEFSREQLAGLVHELRTRVPGSVHDMHAAWSDGALGTSHLEEFCRLFLEHQRQVIDRALGAPSAASASVRRASDHHEFAVQRSSGFRGRRSELRAISSFIGFSRTAGPLVVIGPGGAGKSALLAAAAERAMSHGRHAVIARFVGASAMDGDPASFLAELCRDVAAACGMGPSEIPSGGFGELLRNCAGRVRLVVFVDAVDQLDDGRQLDPIGWIPDQLPPNVRLIVSVRDGELARRLSQRPKRRLVRLSGFPISDARALLLEWVAQGSPEHDPWRTCSRTLQGRQVEGVLRAFRGNGCLLWLRILAEEARRWPATAPCPSLPRTVQGMVGRFRSKILRRFGHHGAVLVDRSLAFIASCRSGISEPEIARALATDPAVQSEFRSAERTGRRWQPAQELPPVLWARLRSDLEPFLAHQHVDGALTMRFFHREFVDYVRTRLVLGPSARTSIHLHLARVFAALAPGGPELIADCKASGVPRSEALRRIMEEPWQLERSGNPARLIELLREPVFCLAKYAANRGDDHVEFIRRLPVKDDQMLALLDRWSAMTSLGDADWPAHRILTQLVLEAEPGVVPAIEEFSNLVSVGIIEAPPLLRAIPARYARGFHRRHPMPQTEGLEFWCRSNRYIEVMGKHGRGLCIDSVSGTCSLLDGRSRRSVRRRRLIPKDLGHGGPSMGFVGLEPGGAVGLPGHGAEGAVDIRPANLKWTGFASAALVLGFSEVTSLGRIGNHEAMLCDGFLYLIAVSEVERGDTQSFTGEICDSLRLEGEEYAPIYERFAATFIESSTSFISLGFSGTHGHSEDIIVEVFEVEGDRVISRALLHPLCSADLPIQAIARLSDGTLMILCDNYKTLIASPPFRGKGELVPRDLLATIPGKGLLNFCTRVDADGSKHWPWIGRVETNPGDGALDESEIKWIKEDLYCWGDGVQVITCASEDEAREMDDPSHLGLEEGFPWLELRSPAGGIERWVSDVPIGASVELGPGPGRYLLVKQSGPVIVRRVSVDGAPPSGVTFPRC